MSIELELICKDCQQELDAEENNSGQIEVAPCAFCSSRMLDVPDSDPIDLDTSAEAA